MATIHQAPNKTHTPKARATKRKVVNAPGFRPTGLGWAITIPDFKAVDSIATGVLVNRGLSPKDGYLSKMPLFIEGVQTGWSIAGDYGQTASSRTFYPRNFSQEEIQIQCIVANNNEYDKVVTFVRKHHETAVDSWDTDPNNGAGPNTKAVDFWLFPYLINTGRVTRRGEPIFQEIYGGLPGVLNGSANGSRVQGYITAMPAGQQFGEFARQFTLSFKVTYDYLANPVHLTGLINKELVERYMENYDSLYGRTSTGKVIPPAKVGPDGLPFEPAPTSESSMDYWSAQNAYNNIKLNQAQ